MVPCTPAKKMITSRSCETSFLGATASKKKGGWVGGRLLASASAPQKRWVPSTARPGHLGGRASGTWPDKEKSESGDEIDKRSAAFPLRCLRGARHPLWRCPSEVYFRSRADVSLCALPLSSSNPPPSPFASYLSCVCPAGGADGFIAKLPPAGVLTGIKILPYKRGQRTRERPVWRSAKRLNPKSKR